jgi:hypothetical protein
LRRQLLPPGDMRTRRLLEGRARLPVTIRHELVHDPTVMSWFAIAGGHRHAVMSMGAGAGYWRLGIRSLSRGGRLQRPVQLIGGVRQQKLVLRHHTVTAVQMSTGGRSIRDSASISRMPDLGKDPVGWSRGSARTSSTQRQLPCWPWSTRRADANIGMRVVLVYLVNHKSAFSLNLLLSARPPKLCCLARP